MKIEDKLKVLAERPEIFGITKLIKIGGSYAIIVPKLWLEFNGVEVDGEYYCRLEVANSQLVFSPIAPEDIESVVIREKKS
ncbi:MAG TPA: hypothetical protein G4O18_06625 [Dehalococcoidia bacterium]|nr:hypothetical protein [Dehalococcoidia bacterium]